MSKQTTTVKHHEIAGSHFNRKTLNALAKKGIAIHSATYLPNAETGTFINGETGYMLDDNGTGRLRNYLQVLELAQ